MDANVPRIWTIGHSTRTADDFVKLLLDNEVSGLADVRTIPRSRRHPHFAREALADRLQRDGVEYRHFPALGGLRKPRPDSVNSAWRNAAFRGYADHMQTPEFDAGLTELLEFARSRHVALMCAEAVWWQCHRMLLSDVLTARGMDVWHITGQTGKSALQRHRLTPFARIDSETEGSKAEPKVYYPGVIDLG